MRYYRLSTTCYFFQANLVTLGVLRLIHLLQTMLLSVLSSSQTPCYGELSVLPFGINCIYAFWKALFKDKMSVDDATYWYTWQYNSISLRNPFGLIQLVSWRGLLKLCFDHKGILLNTAVVESFIQCANACLRYLFSSATSLI